MIYGKVKNRVVKNFVRNMLTPCKDWIYYQFNDTQARKIGCAMLKYYKSIGFYERYNKELQQCSENTYISWFANNTCMTEHIKKKFGYRYVSTKYIEVVGDWCDNEKLATESFNLVLNNFKKSQ